MPSSYPFPSLAALCLSLYSSEHRIERLPVIVEVQPYEIAGFVETPKHLRETFVLCARFGTYEGI